MVVTAGIAVWCLCGLQTAAVCHTSRRPLQGPAPQRSLHATCARCCRSVFWTCESPALQVGHPDYEVMGGSATYKGRDLLELEPEDRARAGLFMSFQSPVEVGRCERQRRSTMQ